VAHETQLTWTREAVNIFSTERRAEDVLVKIASPLSNLKEAKSRSRVVRGWRIPSLETLAGLSGDEREGGGGN